jgi:glycosyltransferase involved in cell wall biosynthesis
VGFVPFQDHPVAVFRALDVVVHASTRPEPFGRTIVEGMACARPVLVSQAGGAAELFIDGQDALGVAPGSVEGLARALRSLAEAPGLRQELGAAARQTAVRRFSRERLGREALPLYTALARGERRAPAP